MTNFLFDPGLVNFFVSNLVYSFILIFCHLLRAVFQYYDVMCGHKKGMCIQTLRLYKRELFKLLQIQFFHIITVVVEDCDDPYNDGD